MPHSRDYPGCNSEMLLQKEVIYLYNYSQNRILSGFIAILIILSVARPVTCAAEGENASYNWYCKRAKDHIRPTLDSHLSWVNDPSLGAYYIDPGCGDTADAQNKVLYLTFDVGYENGNVAKVLDTLAEKQVKGTFFILSHIVEAETPLVLRMFEDGHTVGNHTATHKDMSKLDRDAFAQELNTLETLCLQKTGYQPSKFYRPPEGRFSKNNLLWAREMGYQTLFWSFAYADWDNNKQPDPVVAVDKIMSNIHNGAVLLLHPTSATNAQILGEVIDRCHAQGYRFDIPDAFCRLEKDNV